MNRIIEKVRYFSQTTLLFSVRSGKRIYRQIRRIPLTPRRSLILGSAIGFLTVSTIVLTNVAWAVALPIPAFGELRNRQVEVSTKLYDRSGKVLLYDTSGSMRHSSVPLSDISPHLLLATIAIEDYTFFEHDGIRPTAIIRALLTNLMDGSLSQGGSTITQQVIKNTLLTKDKSLIRKLKEWVLALRIENHYSKDQILETYLNETPYGGTIYGVEEASQAYFAKPAKDLGLSEAAYIAALPKAPSYFSPWGSHPEALKKRQKLVLAKMHEYDFISESEYHTALVEETAFAERNTENIKAPHFVFYVLSELEKQFGEEAVYKGGLQVLTTLDWGLQRESEAIIREGALQNEKNFNAKNAGMVAIDPKTGQVLAMVGSRNYFDDSVDGQVNVALAERQPGSAFKPFVYAMAFKKGYTPDTVLFDLKTQFSTACDPSNFSNEYPCYSPDNYDSEFRGPMTMRDALAQSVNVVAVKTLYLSGMNDAIDMARSLGITTLTDAKRYGLSLVLGGGEVKLLDMTSAYGVFANDGERYPATPILSVREADGETLFTYEGKSEQVLDPEIARTINDLLSDNEARAPAFGEYSPLYFKEATVADKTGTTNDYRDAWVIGYTSSIVVGAWAGNNDNTPMAKKVSSYILAPMWHEVMKKAIARFPAEPFRRPTEEFAALPPPLSGSGPWETNPTGGVHEILYYVNKNNPRDTAPFNPFADPQIARWEYPVALWAGQQASSTVASGTPQFDDIAFGIGGRDDVPLEMSIASPGNGGIVAVNQPFMAGIRHSEIENVLRVSYYLNGALVGSSNTAPFSLFVMPISEGPATLRAVAESPLGEAEASIAFTVGPGRGE